MTALVLNCSVCHKPIPKEGQNSYLDMTTGFWRHDKCPKDGEKVTPVTDNQSVWNPPKKLPVSAPCPAPSAAGNELLLTRDLLAAKPSAATVEEVNANLAQTHPIFTPQEKLWMAEQLNIGLLLMKSDNWLEKLANLQLALDKLATDSDCWTALELTGVTIIEPDVVEGFAPASSVGIDVGDSGIGKSPLMYQLALCVAAGIPFLGWPVQQRHVIVADFENGKQQIDALVASLMKFLSLKTLPRRFHLLKNPTYQLVFEKASKYEDALVIVDSLRMFDPDAEKSNPDAGKLMWELQKSSRKHGTVFRFLHHLRKPDVKAKPTPLSDTPALDWLLQACGPRGLVNQTQIRVGLERDEGGLVMRYFSKLIGDSGPIYIGRVYDPVTGDPLGYRRRTGAALLKNPMQEKAFAALPADFRFGQAKQVYGRGSDATNDFLKKSIAVDILKKDTKDGKYHKTPKGLEGPERAD